MSPTSPDMDLPLLYSITFKPYNLPETFPVSLFTVCTVFLSFLLACFSLIVCITSAFENFFFFGENPVFLSLFFTILTLIENYTNFYVIKIMNENLGDLYSSIERVFSSLWQ